MNDECLLREICRILNRFDGRARDFLPEMTEEAVNASAVALAARRLYDSVVFEIVAVDRELSAHPSALARDVENIVAVKEASGNLEQIKSIIEGAPKGFCVLSGNDDETHSVMRMGGHGVVSVASNVAPQEMADFVHAAQLADWETAAAINHLLKNLFKNLFIEPNPIPGKAAMALMGLMENSLRLPLVPAKDATVEIMKETLDQLWK